MEVIINQTTTNLNGFYPVKKFLTSEYGHITDDTIIVLGYNNGKSFSEFKKSHSEKKIIIFQLEQLSSPDNLWYNEGSDLKMVQKRTKHIGEWLDGCDEIWEYDLENIKWLRAKGYSKIKHVSLYPVKSVAYNIKSEEYDIAFYGALNDRRVEYLKELDKRYKLLVIYNKNGVYAKKNNPEFKNSIDLCYADELFRVLDKVKIVINIHYYTNQIQEQVRLFELLSNDKFVISEKSKIDYFNGVIPEFSEKNEMFKLIDNYLSNIKIGVAYSTFYGLELLEENIKKFRNKVHYVVVVHQKIGLSGNKEPEGNDDILNKLLKDKLVDEVVYYDLESSSSNQIIEKRNIGLESCKRNNCDYIVPLDADESYDFTKLRQDIIDGPDTNTFYSPIKTYYYNKEYYFDEYFHVASAYKIDNRRFENVKTSFIVDPHRKMRESSYKMTDTPLLHYNYLIDSYKYKIDNKIGITTDKDLSSFIKQVYDYLLIWKPGKKAKILRYLNGKRCAVFVDLKREGPETRKGYTSDILIKDNLVYKTVKDGVTKFKISAEELITREIYWLKRLEQYDIAPKFIERDNDTIIMSYCGEVIGEKDINNPAIQVQLLKIIRILLENHCYYNDFKLDNFTIKNGKLYVIDFGWCPEIIEDYTCHNTVGSNLTEKPYNNIFDLFDSINENRFLDKETYFRKVNILKEQSPEHWVTNKNGDDCSKRWEYHKESVDILKQLNPASVLEAGTMGVNVYNNSDTIDYDLPDSGWKLSYIPTYNHDLRNLPWPIRDKEYDAFIALRVFHHFKGDISRYFNEMVRVSNHIILALPKSLVETYRKIRKPLYEFVCEESDTAILHYDNLVKTEEKITVGLVYSGRVQKVLREWLDKLLNDIKDRCAELIIINNSKKELPSFVEDYKKYFFNFTEVVDESVVDTKGTSEFLSKSYTTILRKAKGTIIHFREDDVVPINNAFDQLLAALEKNKNNKPIVSGVYQNRRKVNSVAMQNIEVLKNGNDSIRQSLYCPTGMVLFYKDQALPNISSKYKSINTHDWAWCEEHRDRGGNVYVVTDAICKHYIDEANFVLPDISNELKPHETFIKTEATSNRGKKQHVWGQQKVVIVKNG